jgi:hypothetical protein
MMTANVQHMGDKYLRKALTFKEFGILITQIEACLNSRHLVAVSSDPNNPSYLSPGHFLIGAPLTSLPDPDFTKQ